MALSAECKKNVTLGIKAWALEHGCVYLAHMYSPLRAADGRVQPGFKFDSLLDLDYADKAVMKPVLVDELSPSALFQSETDGSSHPNGGIRFSHRAAAFMSWDKSSPPFIRKVLSVFFKSCALS